LLLIAFLPCAACTRSQPPPNLIVILIDALRADHLGCYGYQRPKVSKTVPLDEAEKERLRSLGYVN
jgi:hypothetical protein